MRSRECEGSAGAAFRGGKTLTAGPGVGCGCKSAGSNAKVPISDDGFLDLALVQGKSHVCHKNINNDNVVCRNRA